MCYVVVRVGSEEIERGSSDCCGEDGLEVGVGVG